MHQWMLWSLEMSNDQCINISINIFNQCVNQKSKDVAIVRSGKQPVYQCFEQLVNIFNQSSMNVAVIGYITIDQCIFNQCVIRNKANHWPWTWKKWSGGMEIVQNVGGSWVSWNGVFVIWCVKQTICLSCIGVNSCLHVVQGHLVLASWTLN